LRGGSLALPCILPGALYGFFFWHDLSPWLKRFGSKTSKGSGVGIERASDGPSRDGAPANTAETVATLSKYSQSSSGEMELSGIDSTPLAQTTLRTLY
jgi:hypothetical protein